jgi:hypothetical protein
MPSAEPQGTKVVLLGPDSASDYLAAGVRFCEQAGTPFYFLIGQELSTQVFSELKNPHLRFCDVCVYITEKGAKSAEFKPLIQTVIGWLAAHNPNARVIGYEICVDGAPGGQPANHQISLPSDLARVLERDLREAGVM